MVAFSCDSSRKTTAFRLNHGGGRTLSLHRKEVNQARSRLSARGLDLSPQSAIPVMRGDLLSASCSSAKCANRDESGQLRGIESK